MKLNNRGWGLQAMMICVLVLMIALVIVAVLVNKVLEPILGSSEPVEKTQTTYQDLEQMLVDGSKKYQARYYDDLVHGEKITVTVKTLQREKMIDTITDIKDDSVICTGYVIFTLENEIKYYPYLKCGSNYTTKGYLNQFDI